MKNLIILISLLGSLVSFSQNTDYSKKRIKLDQDGFPTRLPNKDFVPTKTCIKYNQIEEPNFDEKLVIQEIAILLDSIREYMYEDDILKTEVDTIANKGVIHHNKYLKNVIDPKDPEVAYLSHCEVKKDHNCFYNGKDTLIYDWFKRMEHFSDETMGFCGEVCSAGALSFISTKGLTPKEIAKNIIYGFYQSKEHWHILTDFSYIKIAADIEIRKNPKGDYVYWFTMCTGFKMVKNKTKIKNKFYFPNHPKLKNDPICSTEFIEFESKTCVLNR